VSEPRILLIGRSGQLAWELRRVLASLGHLYWTARGPASSAQALRLDLRDLDAIRTTVRSLRPCLIVNAAAYTDVERAEQETDLAQRINAQAPGVLAEEAARLDGALVHFSTDYVFDGASKRPYRETDPAKPLNAYGRSKLAGEQAVRAALDAHLIIRTSWLYAARGRNFLRTMLRLGRERDRVSVVDDQLGSPTSARVLAEATGLILERTGISVTDRLARRAGTYHLAAAGSCTWYDFAKRIFALSRLGSDAPEVEAVTSARFGARAVRPVCSVLDCSKARRDLGVELPHWTEQLAAVMEGIGSPVRSAAGTGDATD